MNGLLLALQKHTHTNFKYRYKNYNFDRLCRRTCNEELTHARMQERDETGWRLRLRRKNRQYLNICKRRPYNELAPQNEYAHTYEEREREKLNLYFIVDRIRNREGFLSLQLNQTKQINKYDDDHISE